MDTVDKLDVLGAAARFDLCPGGCDGGAPRSHPLVTNPGACGLITQAQTADGGAMSLFKVLQSNDCRHNCHYCANRADRGHQRAQFSPEELAALFMDFHRRGYADGLFLISAVTDTPGRSMGEMLKTAELLRGHYGYTGYLHLKVLPGAPYDCVERAVQLADRVSINIEAPTAAHLTRIAPQKHLTGDVVQRMHWIKRAAAASDGRMSSGQTTQLVVGAGRETDREILSTVTALYREVGLRRAYFSAFHPISATPLAEAPPAPLMRQHRLYQADWLLRRYDGAYGADEIAYGADGNLPLGLDPKLAIALRDRARTPVEVNRATYAELLRVPGIGPRSARRIIVERKSARFSELTELRRVGVAVKRAAPFVLINGKAQGNINDLAAEWSRRRIEERQLPLPMGI